MTHKVHLLALEVRTYVAVCSCRWTGERYHRSIDAAADEALAHTHEHGEPPQLIEVRDLATTFDVA